MRVPALICFKCQNNYWMQLRFEKLDRVRVEAAECSYGCNSPGQQNYHPLFWYYHCEPLVRPTIHAMLHCLGFGKPNWWIPARFNWTSDLHTCLTLASSSASFLIWAADFWLADFCCWVLWRVVFTSLMSSSRRSVVGGVASVFELLRTWSAATLRDASFRFS